MITRETWARQHWTQNPLIGCPKGQMMRGILKEIKHLPCRQSDRSALNNPHNRKLQDYARLTRSEQGKPANRKYKCYLDSQNMHHLTKTILAKSVIDTYENTGLKDNTRTRRHPSSPPGTRMSPPPNYRNLQNLGYRAKPRSPYSCATTKCKQIIHKNLQTAQEVCDRNAKEETKLGQGRQSTSERTHNAVQSVGKEIQ